MAVTIALTVAMMVLLFLMIWAATVFLPWQKLMDFFPEDIRERAKNHPPPFPAAPALGWVAMGLCTLGFVAAMVYGGWDGLQRGYTFGQFLGRFLIMLYGLKAFDILCLDYVLITKTQFFQHYFPETKGCAGYSQFGYNYKQQLRQILTMPVFALLSAWICAILVRS